MRLIKFCIFLSVFNIFSANNSGLADMVGTKPTDSSTPSQSSTTAQASALSEILYAILPSSIKQIITFFCHTIL